MKKVLVLESLGICPTYWKYELERFMKAEFKELIRKRNRT